MSSKLAARRRASGGAAKESSRAAALVSNQPPRIRAPSLPPKTSTTHFIPKTGRNEVEGTFERLRLVEKIEGTDVISGKGLLQFFSEMSITASSLDAMVLLWKLGCSQEGVIARYEWLSAMYTNNLNSLMQLKFKLCDWAKEVRESKATFLLMYNFLYDNIRGETHRVMPMENAVKAWAIFFAGNKRLERFKRWCRAIPVEEVSRDLWRQAGVLFLLDDSTLLEGDKAQTKQQWSTLIEKFLSADAEPKASDAPAK